MASFTMQRIHAEYTLKYPCTKAIKCLYWNAKMRQYIIFKNLKTHTVSKNNYETKEPFTIFSVTFTITHLICFHYILYF